jgi:uncharacterized membrane protein
VYYIEIIFPEKGFKKSFTLLTSSIGKYKSTQKSHISCFFGCMCVLFSVWCRKANTPETLSGSAAANFN